MDTIGTSTVCSEYRDVCILEASGIFPVGVAMHTHAVELYEGTSRTLPCYTLVRKAKQGASAMHTSISGIHQHG